MSDLRDVGRMLEAAEQAAAAGDLASADELLRNIARIQEVELGPLHPDLANTLNNLGVVAEKTGRLDAAERFYRQAVTIATASLPADHPMLAESRENLKDFCRAQGLAIDPAAPTIPTSARPGTATGPSTAAGPETSVPPEQHQAAPRKPSASLAMPAIGVAIILIAVVLFMMSRDSSAPEPTAAPAPPQIAERTEPAAPQATEPAAPNPADTALPAPTREGQSPAAGPRSDDRSLPTAKPPATARSSSAIALVTTELCRTFSTREAKWTCDPAVDPVSPGPIVFYTRVTSPADAVVVHRWYRGDTLRQSVNLQIRASATEGYRTYSRQTVDAGEWRVEVRNVEGTVLHEQRFVVR